MKSTHIGHTFFAKPKPAVNPLLLTSVYFAEWDESKHPRDGGQFAEKEGNDDSEEHEDEEIHPRQPPGSQSEVQAVAAEMREALESVCEDAAGYCASATQAFAHVFPTSEKWSGSYKGSPHVVSKIGKYFVDITADQFGGEAVRVMDKLPKDYKKFSKDRPQPIRDPELAAQSYQIALAFQKARGGE